MPSPTALLEPMATFGGATPEARDGAAVAGAGAAAMTTREKKLLIDCCPECKTAPPGNETNASYGAGPMAMAGAHPLWT